MKKHIFILLLVFPLLFGNIYSVTITETQQIDENNSVDCESFSHSCLQCAQHPQCTFCPITGTCLSQYSLEIESNNCKHRISSVSDCKKHCEHYPVCSGCAGNPVATKKGCAWCEANSTCVIGSSSTDWPDCNQLFHKPSECINSDDFTPQPYLGTIVIICISFGFVLLIGALVLVCFILNGITRREKPAELDSLLINAEEPESNFPILERNKRLSSANAPFFVSSP